MKKELILYVISKALKEYGYPKVDKLQIVKILYLMDRKALFEKHINKISDYEYLLERLGPLAWEILDDLESLKLQKLIDNADNYYDFIIANENTEFMEAVKKAAKIIDLIFTKTELDEIFNIARNVSSLLNYVHSLEEVKNGEFKKKIF